MKRSPEQRLEHILHRMQSDTSVDAPADAVRYIKNLYRTHTFEAKPSLIQRIAAVLSVDIAPGTVAFGERSAGGGQARQMLFDAGENAVDLRVTATDEGFNVRGQILGNGFESGVVQLADDSATVTATISEIGEFQFVGLTGGEINLTARGTNTEIFIEKIILS